MIAKPLFGLSGGKFNTIKFIIDHTPEEFNDYYEPFFGAGSMFFKLNMNGKKCYLNDIDKYKIDFYKCIKKSPEKFIKELYNLDNNKEDYRDKVMTKEIIKKNTGIYNDYKNKNIIERSVAFYVLSKCSFRGCLRTPSVSRKNVLEDYTFKECKQNDNKIKNSSVYLNQNDIKFSNKDYNSVLKTAKKGDFVYLDPPYFQIKKNDGIFDKVWNYKNDLEVCEVFKKLDKKGCKVLMSNSDHPDIKKILKDYEIIEIDVFRNGTHTTAKELLIKNY